jgi:alkylhydroperoxidase family enzyme
VHGCRSCNKGNRLDAEAAGLSSGKIAAIGDIESNVFNAADKAVIQLADLMSLHANGGRLSQSLYDDLRVHFNDGEILELSLVFSFLAGMAHFLFAFDMVEREDSCQF